MIGYDAGPNSVYIDFVNRILPNCNDLDSNANQSRTEMKKFLPISGLARQADPLSISDPVDQIVCGNAADITYALFEVNYAAENSFNPDVFEFNPVQRRVQAVVNDHTKVLVYDVDRSTVLCDLSIP